MNSCVLGSCWVISLPGRVLSEPADGKPSACGRGRDIAAWALEPAASGCRLLDAWQQAKGSVDACLGAAHVNARQRQPGFSVRCVQHPHLTATDEGASEGTERAGREAGQPAVRAGCCGASEERGHLLPAGNRCPPAPTALLPDQPRPNTGGYRGGGQRHLRHCSGPPRGICSF